MGDGIVQADGVAQIAVQDAVPVVDVLRVEGQIEANIVTLGGYIGRGRALAQHHLNRVAGDQVDEQKDERDHQPDDRNGEHEAGEGLLHSLVSTIYQSSGVSDQ